MMGHGGTGGAICEVIPDHTFGLVAAGTRCKNTCQHPRLPDLRFHILFHGTLTEEICTPSPAGAATLPNPVIPEPKRSYMNMLCSTPKLQKEAGKDAELCTSPDTYTMEFYKHARQGTFITVDCPLYMLFCSGSVGPCCFFLQLALHLLQLVGTF
jgi:hypothetical protein